MKIDLKKINFRQPKYMAPLIALPILLFIIYQIADIFAFEAEPQEGPVITQTVNTDMPEVRKDADIETKSKYQAMLEGYGKVTDYTAVEGAEKEEEKLMQMDKIYDDQEKRRIDSLMAVQVAQAEAIKQQLQQQQKQWERQQNEQNVITRDEALQQQQIKDKQAEDFNNNIVKQMQLAQKLANGERILTEEEKKAEEIKLIQLAERQRVLDSIAKIQAPVAVTKAEMVAEQHFNTVSDDVEDPKLIKARVDRVEKVKDGSRIRLRLSEDVEIEGEIMPEGSYLYATVSGFTAQRVKATVTSAMLGSSIKQVKLSVYDLDGMEGFYVPSSNFREMARDIGAQSMQMNLNMNQTGSNMSMENLAMQSLQQALQGTTQAISKNIRQNKARIKMNTQCYLVDTSNN